MYGLHVQSLVAADSTATGTVVTLDGELNRLAVYITTDTGTVSAGAVTIEEAATSGYTGTWSAMTSDTAGSAAITLVSGTTIARHYTGCYANVRPRLSTGLTGGAKVTVDIFGNLGS